MKRIGNDYKGKIYILGIDAGANGYMTLINALNNSVLIKMPIPSDELIIKPPKYKVDKTQVYQRGKNKGQYKMRMTKGAKKESRVLTQRLSDIVKDIFQAFGKDNIQIVIENQSGGGFIGSQTSKDTMMKNYGRLLSVFELLGVNDIHEVSPRVWKKELDIQLSTKDASGLTNAERTKVRKGISIDLYKKLYGHTPDSHDQAESALIAYWYLVFGSKIQKPS